MEGFDKFWAAWPRSTRKGAKSACLAKWKKGYYETCHDQIIKHVEWMKTTDDWRKQNGAFIPAPLVYLNQQRWDGAEIPEMVTKSGIDPELAKKISDAKTAARPPSDFFEQLRKKLHS